MLVKKQFVVINYIFLTIVFLFCFFATNFIVFGQEDETKIVAEDFLKHIFSNEPHFKLLNGYCLSDELQKSLTANGACEFWNKTLEHEYGILGNYKKVEVMNYQGNNRHVYFYYKGSKQNVKFWVTFHGNEITGFYWEPWVDPIIPVSLNPVSSKLSHPIFIVIMFVSFFTIVVLEIYFGEKWRAYFIQKKQKSVPVFYNNNKETYRESQNPFWFYLLWGTSLFFVFFSFSIYYIFYGLSSIDFNSFFILVSIFITIFLVFFIPLCLFGLYIEVNNICLVIRLGLFRRCILQINIDDIISVEKTNFNALRDFGGWGIRLGKAGVMGYFNMSGNKGVVVTTHAGKKYILGSDNPNHLAHVIAIRIKTLETLH